MSGITSHVLDTSLGIPGKGIRISLERSSGKGWNALGNGVTDDDGRVSDLSAGKTISGNYRMTFEVESYFADQDRKAFYPIVRIEFSVDDPQQHYHVPLLLNPFGYSTYRGS